MDTNEEAREENETQNRAMEPLVRLTSRDKELLAHVAVTRYLTFAQLKRLVFVRPLVAKKQQGSSSEGPSEIVCKRRLTRLCSGPTPYLRRLIYRDREGAPVAVYAAEKHGQAIARQVLRRAPLTPTQDLKAQFLEHTVTLNDLYVALAEGCARQRMSPGRYPPTISGAHSAPTAAEIYRHASTRRVGTPEHTFTTGGAGTPSTRARTAATRSPT